MNEIQKPKFLEGLNPRQKEAVETLEGPLLVLAGAGSGKTRVIVCRIANLIAHGVKPWNILAVTFTNKAAAEMRTRVDDLVQGKGRGAWVSTFHAFCAQIIRVEAKNLKMDPDFVIYDQSDQISIIKGILKDQGVSEKEITPNQILNAISRAKDDLLDAGSYQIHARTHNDAFRLRVAAVYDQYQKQLKMANALDFGDLIMKTVEAFRDMPPLREKYQKRFRYIMVDEYQDTNHAQYLLVKYMAGETKNVCVVGDDDQSIYSWRGATIRNILEFERDYKGAKSVTLDQNYRSTGKILKVAGKLVAHNEKRKAKTLWTENEDGEDVLFNEVVNEQEEARFVVEEIQRLQEKEGLALKDVSVFYRTNAQSRVFEDALRRTTLPYTIVGALRFYERAEIKDALAYLRLTVNPRDNVSLKRVINLPARGVGKNSLGQLEQYAASQGISLFEALDRGEQIKGVSPAAQRGAQTFLGLIRQFKKHTEEFGASAVVRRVLEESGYWDHWAAKVDSDPEAGERLDNLQELINAAKDFEENFGAQEDPLRDFDQDSSSPPARLPDGQAPQNDTGAAEQGEENTSNSSVILSEAKDLKEEKPTLSRFLQDVSLMTDLDQWKGSGGSVTLMTIHLAKGLEFPAVFVTGLEEGLFPIGDSAFDQEELEEERRLAYVAMTRAKRKLYLTCASSRRIFGTPRMNIPSRFVDEAGIASTAPAPSPQRRGGQQANFDEFAQVGPSDDYNFNQEEVYDDGPVVRDEGGVSGRLDKIIKKGSIVAHPDFGNGKVLDKEGSGSSAKVTVVFPGGVKKKLLLKYAPLRLIK